MKNSQKFTHYTLKTLLFSILFCSSYLFGADAERAGKAVALLHVKHYMRCVIDRIVNSCNPNSYDPENLQQTETAVLNSLLYYLTAEPARRPGEQVNRSLEQFRRIVLHLQPLHQAIDINLVRQKIVGTLNQGLLGVQNCVAIGGAAFFQDFLRHAPRGYQRDLLGLQPA